MNRFYDRFDGAKYIDFSGADYLSDNIEFQMIFFWTDYIAEGYYTVDFSNEILELPSTRLGRTTQFFQPIKCWVTLYSSEMLPDPISIHITYTNKNISGLFVS